MEKETVDTLLLSRDLGCNSRRTNMCLDEIVSLRTRLAAAEQERNRLRSREAFLEGEILNGNPATMQIVDNETARKVQEYGVALQAAEKERDELRAANDELNAQLIKEAITVDELRTQLEQRSCIGCDEWQQYKKEADELRTSLEQSALSAASVRRECLDLKAENERLAGEVERLKSQQCPHGACDTLEGEIGELRRRAEQAESVLAAAQGEAQNLTDFVQWAYRDSVPDIFKALELESYAAQLNKKALASALEEVEKMRELVLRVHSGDNWVTQYPDNPGVCVCDVCEPIRNGQIPQLTAAQQSAKEQFRAVAEKMAVAGFDAIASYRCSTLVDESGDGAELSDIIATALGDSDIGRAKEELRHLSDHVYNAIREAAKEGSK